MQIAASSEGFVHMLCTNFHDPVHSPYSWDKVINKIRVPPFDHSGSIVQNLGPGTGCGSFRGNV